MNTEEKMEVKISAHDLTILCCEISSLRLTAARLEKENSQMKEHIAKLEGEVQ